MSNELKSLQVRKTKLEREIKELEGEKTKYVKGLTKRKNNFLM